MITTDHLAAILNLKKAHQDLILTAFPNGVPEEMDPRGIFEMYDQVDALYERLSREAVLAIHPSDEESPGLPVGHPDSLTIEQLERARITF
jgi:hypothetical protein